MSKIFPRSANTLPLQIVVFLIVLGTVMVAAVTYYSTPKYLDVGYQPIQPVPFSHALHAGQIGLDCRYCHLGVDQGPASTIPTAQTCMNCHSLVKAQSPLLAVVRQSYQTGAPVPWVKIHVAPEYVYFNHSVHVNRGVSCVECHGRIDEMDTVYRELAHSMAFCLDCHRQPERFLREPKDVYNLASSSLAGQGRLAEAKKIAQDWKVKPPQSCSGCHR
ncbi:MAG: cytochrome c3 family protein [Opitutaceae bacterium]|nr:cytochrome c3 family protein [Opitutaceae bacterium]